MDVEIKTANQETISDVLPLINKANEYFTKIANKSRLPKHTLAEYNYQEEAVVLDENILEQDMVIYAVYKTDGGDEVVVGCVSLDWFNTESPYVTLNDLYVDEAFRRKGIAKQLAYHAINTAHEKKKHVQLGILHDNQSGNAFWESFFKTTPLITNCPIYTLYYIAK